MYSPSLQHRLIQAHIQDLHRSRQTRSTQPITTSVRTATPHRHTPRVGAYLARAIERFVGHPGPEAPAI